MDYVNTFTVFFNQPDKGTSDDNSVPIWGDLPSLLQCGYTKTDYERQSGYLSYSLQIPFDVHNTCVLGIFPAKNWMATGKFTPVEQIGVAAMDTRNVGREFCSGCPVGWSQLKLARTEPYSGILAEGPEFETLYSFGGQTGVDNINAIIAADRLSDELGLDTYRRV